MNLKFFSLLIMIDDADELETIQIGILVIYLIARNVRSVLQV